MNTKLHLLALSAALMSAGQSIMESAEAIDSDEVEEGGVTATTVTDTTRDSAGLPWHPEIHAGTKKMKADGTWTRKKGVADTYFNQVVAELRKTNPEPQATASATPTLALPGTTPTLALPGAAATGLPSLTLPPTTLSNYQKLVSFISKNVDQPGRRLTIAYINDTFKANNVDPATLATNEAGAELWLSQFRSVLTQIGETEAV